MASIALRDLTFAYPPSDPDAESLSGAGSLGKAALSHVSVTIPDGTFVTLYGENRAAWLSLRGDPPQWYADGYTLGPGQRVSDRLCRTAAGRADRYGSRVA